MSMNMSTSNNSTSSVSLNRVKFAIFLTLQIPSLTCSLYLFSQYITRQRLRQSVHNHVVIALLYSSFVFVSIPVSISETFFFTSHVRPESNLFCAFWTWIHYSINIGNLILMAFACGERHWRIFRLNAIQRLRTRPVCHYIPITICIIYPWLCYFVLIFLYPCKPVYDYTQLLCMMPCYFLTKSVGSIDTFLNNWVPIFTIPILSGTLFIRFLVQKRRMQMELFQWKRDRRMVIQLLSITSLYCCMWAPLQVAAVYANMFNGGIAPSFLVDYLGSLPYFVHLLYPFVILVSNPELRQRSRDIRPQVN